MSEFTFLPDDDGPDIPSYKEAGRILFEVVHVYRSPSDYDRYEIEVIDYDGETSIYWLNEGMGIDYFLKNSIDIDDVGFFVIEGVTGEYIRGDGWATDDDEEWGWGLVRRADPEEVSTGSLRPADKKIKKLARFLAETLNGGAWGDQQFYTKEQRRLWRRHAKAVLDFLWRT